MRKPVGKRLLPPATVGALPLDSTATKHGGCPWLLGRQPSGSALLPNWRTPSGTSTRRCGDSGKADPGPLRPHLHRTDGLSRAQLTRLVSRYLAEGGLLDDRELGLGTLAAIGGHELLRDLGILVPDHGRLMGKPRLNHNCAKRCARPLAEPTRFATILKHGKGNPTCC